MFTITKHVNTYDDLKFTTIYLQLQKFTAMSLQELKFTK